MPSCWSWWRMKAALYWNCERLFENSEERNGSMTYDSEGVATAHLDSYKSIIRTLRKREGGYGGGNEARIPPVFPLGLMWGCVPPFKDGGSLDHPKSRGRAFSSSIVFAKTSSLVHL